VLVDGKSVLDLVVFGRLGIFYEYENNTRNTTATGLD